MNLSELVASHMLDNARVGDIRAARRAGQSPATAPIPTAAPLPPAQARSGMAACAYARGGRSRRPTVLVGHRKNSLTWASGTHRKSKVSMLLARFPTALTREFLGEELVLDLVGSRPDPPQPPVGAAPTISATETARPGATP